MDQCDAFDFHLVWPEALMYILGLLTLLV